MTFSNRISDRYQIANLRISRVHIIIEKDSLGWILGFHTTCAWKGEASYYSLLVGGELNPEAVWYYPDPKPEAAMVKDRVAFWKGVKVES